MTGITMGSLFDGIGGFPLSALRHGITPVWASEIEAFPIEVTKEQFPNMIHVGDITKLDGAELPPVQIICGGSPCQDLSVAGARAGLSGERSGLFMEQIRIVKEMRAADIQCGRTGVDVRPRWMCWENVPGAFSSGTPKYEDFRIVLEEIVRIHKPRAAIPSSYPYLLPVKQWLSYDCNHEYTIRLLYIAFQRCSSTVKKQHTDTGFRAVLAALFSFVQVAVFEPNFF